MREQVAINISGQVQNIVVAMLPENAVARSCTTSGGIVPPKAIKETEKGLHAMQIGKLDVQANRSEVCRKLPDSPARLEALFARLAKLSPMSQSMAIGHFDLEKHYAISSNE